MEKDWEARFRLGDPRWCPPSVIWLLFALTSAPLLWIVRLMVFSASPWWIQMVVTPSLLIGGILMAYRLGKWEMLKFCGEFFLLGVIVAVLCCLLLEFVVPRGWWTLLLFALCPAQLLILVDVPFPPPTISDVLVMLGISGFGNGVCYAILGGFLFMSGRTRSRHRSAKFQRLPNA